MILGKTFQWLFESPPEPVTAWKTVLWWESRRPAYNLIVLGFAIPAFIVFYVSLLTSGHLEPGEDAVEPLALIFAPIALNLCYTLGWLVDAPLRLLFRSLPPAFSSLLFKMGLGFSLLLISLPALGWGGHRLLQLLRIL